MLSPNSKERKMLANRNIKKHIISSRVFKHTVAFHESSWWKKKKRLTLCCLPAESTYEHFTGEEKKERGKKGKCP